MSAIWFIAACISQPLYIFGIIFSVAGLARRRGVPSDVAISIALAVIGLTAYGAFGFSMLLLPGQMFGKALHGLLCVSGIVLALYGLLRGGWRDEIAVPIAMTWRHSRFVVVDPYWR